MKKPPAKDIKKEIASHTNVSFEEDLNWNDEIIEDVESNESTELVVYSRDWTEVDPENRATG